MQNQIEIWIVLLPTFGKRIQSPAEELILSWLFRLNQGFSFIYSMRLVLKLRIAC